MNLHIRPGKLEDYQGTIAGIDSSFNQLVSSIAKITVILLHIHMYFVRYLQKEEVLVLCLKKTKYQEPNGES